MLHFDNDLVRMTLINNAGIEKAALAPTIEDADAIVQRRGQNVRICYTSTGNSVSLAQCVSSEPSLVLVTLLTDLFVAVAGDRCVVCRTSEAHPD